MFPLTSYYIWIACLVVLIDCQGSSKNYGHSKLVLFRGKERHEIDGKSCTVGVVFDKPERFSCACVNGIWAFYNEPCAAPLAMIGGNNFCFRMPNIPIRHITTVSSPMRALSNSLTVFEKNMESVKTKVFRNVHMQLDETTDFVTMNSSWTLLSQDGKDEICLNSRDSKLEDFIMEGTGQKSESVFCTFRNVSQAMPDVGAILKGCNETAEVFEPTDCQPVLPSNSEDICASLPVLEAFEVKYEADNNDLELFRAARSNLLNWGLTTTTTTTTTTETPTTTSTSKYPPGYDKAPGWLQREIRQMVDSKNYSRNGRQFGRAMDSDSENNEKSDSEILEIIRKEWENPMDFTLPPPSHSDPIITDQLWKYQRKMIREQLNIKTPDDMIISENNSTGKASQLLFITRDVMKKICPLQKPEYFDMITEVFLQVQKKIFRWKEPYVTTLDFKRIEAALTACRESAVPLVKPSGTSCSSKGGTFSSPPAIPMPEPLKSDGYEPIIESVWKILVSAHSYCYKNFNQFFNDHHKFTTIMFPFFTNQIHHHWFRNSSSETDEYAGIIGSVAKIISNIDQCAFAARTKSSYPFHLTRPTPLVKYDEGTTVVQHKEKIHNIVTSKKKDHGSKGPDPEPELVEEPEPVTESESASESETQSPTESESTSESETEPVTESESASESETEPLTESDTEPVTESESDTEPVTESESETVTESKSTMDFESVLPESVETAPESESVPELSEEKDAVEKPDLVRRRRDAKSDTQKGESTNKKRKIQPLLSEEDTWKSEREVMNGLGYCLKKYNEPKVHLGYNC